MKLPILAVLGHKDSGKTTVIEIIVKELIKKGYKIATAKHIDLTGFSIDTCGRDTWRHSKAGANPVISVSDIEIAVLKKNGYNTFSVDILLEVVSKEIDAIVLEGFSKIVLDNEYVGIILCVNNEQEFDFYQKKVKRKIIAYCTDKFINEEIIKLPEDTQILVNRMLKFIEREMKILKILENLPGLECKKCGYASCREFSEAVYNAKATNKDCIPKKLKSELKTNIIFHDIEIPIQSFVSTIIRNSILGMVSSLKGITLNGNEKIQVKIYN